MISSPDRFLTHRVPGEQIALQAIPRALFCGRLSRRRQRIEVDTNIVGDVRSLIAGVNRKREIHLLGRYIDQPGLWVERHRLPIVASERSRLDIAWLASFVIPGL